MPMAIVERSTELIEQAAARRRVGPGTLDVDTLLKHGADDVTIFGAPKIGAGVQQTLARGLRLATDVEFDLDRLLNGS